MFIEVRYKTLRDQDRLDMYDDMEKREAKGQKVVSVVPFQTGNMMFNRGIVEIMIVIYRHES